MQVRQAYPIEMLVAAVTRQSHGRLAQELVGPYQGVAVRSVGSLSHAKPDEVAFLANSKYIDEVKTCQAGVVVLRAADKEKLFGADNPRAMIITPDPYAWFAFALQVVQSMLETFESGIHPQAHVAVTAKVDPTARVDAGAVVEDHAVVGAHAWIGAGSVVGARTVIGESTRLHPNVTIAHDCKVGARCIFQPGCVIGGDGFGFAPFEGTWVKIPQIGGVTIEDDVEIGANTCVDRGALEDTVIGAGSKIDNLIQIAHNCKLGRHCVMAGAASIAGSTTLGDHVIVGGAANINGHIKIPSDTTIGPATTVTAWPKDDTKLMMGFFPAMPNRDYERAAVLVRRLPEIRKQIKALESAVEQLKTKEEGQ